LARLAHLLREVNAENIGLGDFAPNEFPFDPLDPAQLEARSYGSAASIIFER